MSCEETKILEFNQYQKPDGCKINPKNSLTTKVDENIPSGSMSTISSIKNIENKHDVYRSKDSMKKIFESLRDHAIKIINFKKKKNDDVNKRAAEII